MPIRFGDVVLDRDARTVTRLGRPVHLSPKALDLLWTLAAARPRVVPKAELLELVWPGTFVTDASLARTVRELRVALGDDVVRTSHGFGYAFGLDGEEAPASPSPTSAPGSRPGAISAWLVSGARAIAIRGPGALIGRDPAADIVIESRMASWHHARLDIDAGGVTLRDLASKNGTTVRGQRLTDAIVLSDGDEIGIAAQTYVFRSSHKTLETATDV